MDRGMEVLGDPKYEALLSPTTKDLTAQIYKVAFDGHFANECEMGVRIHIVSCGVQAAERWLDF